MLPVPRVEVQEGQACSCWKSVAHKFQIVPVIVTLAHQCDGAVIFGGCVYGRNVVRDIIGVCEFVPQELSVYLGI
jgi:hypothetical protein